MAVPMSVRRLVATMSVEGVNVREFCAQHEMSPDTFYRIRRQYQCEGDAAFELKSRAAKTIPSKTPLAVEDRIVELRKELTDAGLDAGPITIEWHLKQGTAARVPSVSTIYRILVVRGFIEPDPAKTPVKPRSFQAERANELWQIDGTEHTLVGGETVKIMNVIDDASRVCVVAQAHPGETLEAAWASILTAASSWGFPERVLSDNAKAFKALETPLANIGVHTTKSRPYHPQTCGKVERFHQTQAQWLAARTPAANLAELQQHLDDFATIYNEQRPHRSIGRRTPISRWTQLPKSGPTNRPLDLTGQHIVTRTVAANGWFRFNQNLIAAGKHLTGETITVIASGPHVHVFHNTELARQLTLTSQRRSYPLHNQRGRPTQDPK